MPASWRTSDLTVLLVAGAGTVLLTAASFMVAPPDTLPRNDGSSYASHPDGARAAFLLLKELGYRVERSFEPVTAIRHTPEHTALVLASPSEAPSAQDVLALQTFVERGGLVLATGPVAAHFLPGVPERSRRRNDLAALRASRPRRQDRALPAALTEGVESVDLPSATAPLSLDSKYVVVYGTDQAPSVVAGRFERGYAVWWAGSAPLVNGAIGRPRHVELLVNSLGPAGARTILWDEFYHGHTRSFWSYLAATPVPFAVLQLAALASVALFTYARRRRPIRERALEPRTSPLEFIDTMGGLYERARASAAAVATVYAHVRRRLLTALGLPLNTGDDRLAAVAAERLAFDQTLLASALSNARAASGNPDLTAKQAVPSRCGAPGVGGAYRGRREGAKTEMSILEEVTAHARRELAKTIVGQAEAIGPAAADRRLRRARAARRRARAWPRRWPSARSARSSACEFHRVQCTPDLDAGRHHRRQRAAHGAPATSCCTAGRSSPTCCSSTRSTGCRRGRRRRCSRRWRSGRSRSTARATALSPCVHDVRDAEPGRVRRHLSAARRRSSIASS